MTGRCNIDLQGAVNCMGTPNTCGSGGVAPSHCKDVSPGDKPARLGGISTVHHMPLLIHCQGQYTGGEAPLSRQDQGGKLGRPQKPLPLAIIGPRYTRGESPAALGTEYGVSRWTITRRLRETGIPIHPSACPRRRGGPFFNVGGYVSTFDRAGLACRVHRGCWEALCGTIPEGHVIHHIDGDRRNNDIGNLQCMTTSEHARLPRRARGRKAGRTYKA